MDVLLQRHCAKHIYIIPEGLRELMSDISREVLRSQPEQIYSFIADYLDALMITRENARVAAKFVESMTQVAVTIREFLTEAGLSKDEADLAAGIIQKFFKKYFGEKSPQEKMAGITEPSEEEIVSEIMDEANISSEQADQAATIIQNAYRQFKKREEEATIMLKGMIDWRVAARSTLRLYRKTGVTYEEANRAATMIKAAYKGYYTRRIIKRLLSEEPTEEIEEEEISFSIGEGEEQSYVIEGFSQSEKIEEEEESQTEDNIGKFILQDLLARVVPDKDVTVAQESEFVEEMTDEQDVTGFTEEGSITEGTEVTTEIDETEGDTVTEPSPE